MKQLLSITALIEALTGLALITMPSMVASVLLGVSLVEPGGVLVGRIGGAALITLAIASWLARADKQASNVMARALSFYNLAAAVLLTYAGAFEHFSGFGIWPTVVLHTGLLGWCLKSIVIK